MTLDELIDSGAPPLIAILRGVNCREAVDVAAALVQSGFRMIEVPLNSPEPFASIAAIQDRFGEIALIGAGTVLSAASVRRLAETGAGLVVTPNLDPDVISEAVASGLEPIPGFLTPSEAFAGLAAGARRLKLFPASVNGPGFISAISDVLPANTGIWAVGGVNAGNAQAWLDAGAEGVALGSAIYRPGDSPEAVAAKAAAVVACLGR